MAIFTIVTLTTAAIIKTTSANTIVAPLLSCREADILFRILLNLFLIYKPKMVPK